MPDIDQRYNQNKKQGMNGMEAARWILISGNTQ